MRLREFIFRMKQFLFEQLHAIVHLFLPLLDRINKPASDRLHDATASWAWPEANEH